MARDAGATREDRLKAALKANMARRKAQGRARIARADAVGDAPGAEAAASEGTDEMDGHIDG